MAPINGERTPKADRYAKQLPEPIPAGSGRGGGGCPLPSAAVMITLFAASLPPVRLAVRAARGARPGVTMPVAGITAAGGTHTPDHSDGGPPERAAVATRDER